MFQKGYVLNGTYPFQWLDLHGAVNSGIMVGWYYWPTQVKKQILSNESTNLPFDFKSMFLGEIHLPWYYIIKIVKLNLKGNMRKRIGVRFLHRWMQIDFSAEFECRVLFSQFWHSSWFNTYFSCMIMLQLDNVLFCSEF